MPQESYIPSTEAFLDDSCFDWKLQSFRKSVLLPQ